MAAIGTTRSEIEIRKAIGDDRDAVLALADRLAAFGPTTRSATEIADRERRALADALESGMTSAELLVAEVPEGGVVGVLLMESREDYFTGERHAHVGILAVARGAEGRGIGRRLLAAAEQWARERGYRRLTLSVFTENRRAKQLYLHEQWQPELETYFKMVGHSAEAPRGDVRRVPDGSS
jgi:GNAT superfamily N-acetyltransferase